MRMMTTESPNLIESQGSMGSCEDSIPALSAKRRDFAAHGLDDVPRALLNILEDLNAEKAGLRHGQHAFLNILEDSVAGRQQVEESNRSFLNILEDSASEKGHLQDAQRAVLNILEDFSREKARLEEAQRSALNILEDFDTERGKVERINGQLENEIRERRRAQEQLVAANLELEAFAYSVAHDLRAPLRSIDGFSQALLEDYANKFDREGNENLRRVRAAALRMADLIEGLLTLSRVTRAELHQERVDLSAMARAIVEELQRSEPDRRLANAIAPGLLTRGDGRLLRVVLQNLLGNAWKFTSRKPQTWIEFGWNERAAQTGAFFVHDNGDGFDMAYADKLFTPFQRLHQQSDFPGTGIGLATVRRIVLRHGGRIWAESVVGEGATFYFTLAAAER